MEIKILPESHTDHGLTQAQLDAALALLPPAPSGVQVATVELPDHLGTVACGLYGPVMGDPPVTDAISVVREGRTGPSRLVSRPPRPTRTVTVIVGPHGEHPRVLYTAFGGPPAPREPWDTSLSGGALTESVAFWSEHALAAPAETE